MIKALITLFLSIFSFFQSPFHQSLGQVKKQYPTPSATASPSATPEPTQTPTPTPAPVVGYEKAMVVYEPQNIIDCPGGVTTKTVPPCRGPYPGYPVNIRNESGTVVYTGKTGGSGYITITLPPGKYYWVQNEEDPGDPTKQSGRRDFTIEAGKTAFFNYFVVFVDVGAPVPTRTHPECGGFINPDGTCFTF